MSNITPNTPSFVFGYWRPWNENSNFFDSYMEYVRDTSLVKYGADTVGKYIKQASNENIQAINKLGLAIGRGMNVLSNQMSDINNTLSFLNRNMDIQIEQQKLSNLLLQNIANLLRVPDNEKERQHSIELGIKFFVNANKDPDLYADALEELLKAESLMKQDYFVLHRIGCIYLYVEKYINMEKALDYFLRAAKYASVESDMSVVSLANILTTNFNTENTDKNNSEKQIGLLAGDSYEKVAFASYVLGRFNDAVSYQSKALKFNSILQNRFILAKYQVRNGNVNDALENLEICINNEPKYVIAAFKEIDLINEIAIINLISLKNKDIDNSIKKLVEKWRTIESNVADTVVIELNELFEKSYEIKIADFKKHDENFKNINFKIAQKKTQIDNLIIEIKKSIFLSFDENKISVIVKELEQAKDFPLEKMQAAYDLYQTETYRDKIKKGVKYAGGIVFYIDQTGHHGLVCAEKDFGKAVWGENGDIGATEDGIENGLGMQNTKKIVELASWHIEKGFFIDAKKPIPTAARLCFESNYNGYSDWYLPTYSELKLMKDIKHIAESFQDAHYWSSTEYYKNSANSINFSSLDKDYSGDMDMRLFLDTKFGNQKQQTNFVRAVRAF